MESDSLIRNPDGKGHNHTAGQQSAEKIAAMNLMAKQQENEQKGALDAQKMYMDANREQQKAEVELETKTKLANIEIVKKLADLDIQKQKAALDAESQQRKILAQSQNTP